MEKRTHTRDTDKYAYFTVRVEKGSITMDHLEHDRRRMGRRHIAEVISSRIADYYDLREILSQLRLAQYGGNQPPAKDNVPADELDEMIGAYEGYAKEVNS